MKNSINLHHEIKTMSAVLIALGFLIIMSQFTTGWINTIIHNAVGIIMIAYGAMHLINQKEK